MTASLATGAAAGAAAAAGCGGGRGLCREVRSAVEHELHHVVQGGEVAQLEVVLAGDVVGLAHGGEGLGLLDGVDAEVGLEVEVHLEHVGGIAGLLGDDLEHLLRDGVARQPGPRPALLLRRAVGAGVACAARSGRRSSTNCTTWFRVGKSRSLRSSSLRDVVGLAHGGEGLGLLDGVDAEIGLEVEVHLEHVGGIAGLLGDDLEDLLRDGVARHRGRGRRCCVRRAVGAGAGLCREVRSAVEHELHHVVQGREVAQLEVVLSAGCRRSRARRRRSRPA